MKVWNKIVLLVLVIGWGVVSIAPTRADEVDRYIQQLKDSNREVRAEAAKALGELGDPRAVDPLIPLLKDEVKLVRARAAEALGTLGDMRAVDPLIPVLKDEDEWVREHAKKALEQLQQRKQGS